MKPIQLNLQSIPFDYFSVFSNNPDEKKLIFIPVVSVSNNSLEWIKTTSITPSDDSENIKTVKTPEKEKTPSKSTLEVVHSDLSWFGGIIKSFYDPPLNQIEHPYFPDNTSPIDIMELNINKIFPRSAGKNELDKLKSLLNTTENNLTLFKDSCHFHAIHKEMLALRNSSNNMLLFFKASLKTIHRMLLENNEPFRQGYEFYWRKNEKEMLKSNQMYAHLKVESFMPKEDGENFIQNISTSPKTRNNKKIKALAYILYNVSLGKSIDYEEFGMLMAFFDIESLLFRTEHNNIIFGGYESFYLKELGEENQPGSTYPETIKIKEKINAITQNPLSSETLYFSQDCLTNLIASPEGGLGFCNYVTNAFLIKMAKLNKNARLGIDKIEVLKLFLIEEQRGTLKKMQDLTFKQPIKAYNLANRLSCLENEFQDEFLSAFEELMHSDLNIGFQRLMDQIKSSEHALKIQLEWKQSTPPSAHIIALIPLSLEERKLYCYFDMNIGLSIVYTESELLMHFRTTLNSLAGHPGSSLINFNDFNFSSFTMNTSNANKLEQVITKHGDKYSDFMQDAAKNKLADWKVQGKITRHADWGKYLNGYKTQNFNNNESIFLCEDRPDQFKNHEDWMESIRKIYTKVNMDENSLKSSDLHSDCVSESLEKELQTKLQHPPHI